MKKEERKKRREMWLNAWHEFLFKHVETAMLLIMLNILGIGVLINSAIRCFAGGPYPKVEKLVIVITVIAEFASIFYISVIKNRKYNEKLSEFTKLTKINNTSDETE